MYYGWGFDVRTEDARESEVLNILLTPFVGYWPMSTLDPIVGITPKPTRLSPLVTLRIGAALWANNRAFELSGMGERHGS